MLKVEVLAFAIWHLFELQLMYLIQCAVYLLGGTLYKLLNTCLQIFQTLYLLVVGIFAN